MYIHVAKNPCRRSIFCLIPPEGERYHRISFVINAGTFDGTIEIFLNAFTESAPNLLLICHVNGEPSPVTPAEAY